jgi:hypothetical protein
LRVEVGNGVVWKKEGRRAREKEMTSRVIGLQPMKVKARVKVKENGAGDKTRSYAIT